MKAKVVSWPTIRVSIGSMRKPNRRRVTSKTLTRGKSRSDGGGSARAQITPAVLSERHRHDCRRLRTKHTRPERGERETGARGLRHFAGREPPFGPGGHEDASDRALIIAIPERVATARREQQRAVMRRGERHQPRERLGSEDLRA